MSGNDSRARFEAWARQRGIVDFSESMIEGNYATASTQNTWEAWKYLQHELDTLNEQYLALIAVHENLRKEMSAPLNVERERCANHIDVSWERSGHDFAEAIRALGTAQGVVSQAAADVLAERQRQISVEGWTPEHDDEHGTGTLALGAACYALPEGFREVQSRKDVRDVGRSAGENILIHDDVMCPRLWPWHGNWWKPASRRRDLVRAGALILAEIERMDRLATQPKEAQS